MSKLITICKKIAKCFIEYRIVDDEKQYRLKHTGLKISYSLKKIYQKNWADVPVNEKKIVFDNCMGKSYGCNPKFVTEELLRQNSDLDIVWTVKDAHLHRSEFPEKIRLVEYGSPEAFMEYATAKFWVSNYHMVAYLNKGLMKKPEQKYIQMWHGSFGIKKIENGCSLLTKDTNWVYLAKKNSEYTDYWISNSGFETQVYQESFWDVSDILEYGHPRNDLFFRKDQVEQAASKVCSWYGVSEKKILLYVPTYRDEKMESAVYPDYEALQSALSERFGGAWVILIRMHPRMKQYAQKIIPQKEFIIDATEYPDIQELLASADVVLSDYSSSIFDFILTRRPGFLFVPDTKEYEDVRGLYYPLSETPFPIAESSRKLVENIRTFDEKEYEKRVEQFLSQKRSKEDGHAAERVVSLIKQLINERG